MFVRKSRYDDLVRAYTKLKNHENKRMETLQKIQSRVELERSQASNIVKMRGDGLLTVLAHMRIGKYVDQILR